jgi:hypothetical protein
MLKKSEKRGPKKRGNKVSCKTDNGLTGSKKKSQMVISKALEKWQWSHLQKNKKK